MKDRTKIELVGEVKQFKKLAGLLKENADYESESGDTDAMGGINEDDSQLTAEEVKDTLLSADLTPEEMKECRIKNTTYGYVEFRYGYWEGHIPQNIANALESHFNVRQNDVDTDEGRLYYYELRPKQNISRINEKSSKVDHFYDMIIEAIRKAARKLDDDSAHELHEKLKAFFNKTI